MRHGQQVLTLKFELACHEKVRSHLFLFALVGTHPVVYLLSGTVVYVQHVPADIYMASQYIITSPKSNITFPSDM